jgi:hypothetical protein
MTGGSIGKPLRRAAAVGLVAVALAVAALLAAVPFGQSTAQRAEIIAVRELIAQRERFLLAAAGQPAQQGKAALLIGESNGALGAELQRHMVELARQNHMSVRSSQVLPGKREPSLAVVGLELSLHGDLTGLRSLLHTVEVGLPILLVEALTIKTAALPRAVQGPVALEINLKVRGYGASKDNE